MSYNHTADKIAASDSIFITLVVLLRFAATNRGGTIAFALQLAPFRRVLTDYQKMSVWFPSTVYLG